MVNFNDNKGAHTMATTIEYQNGFEVIFWDSEDKDLDGVYCINSENQWISYNGVKMFLFDELGNLEELAHGFTGHVVSMAKMYLVEWMYSRCFPTTEKDFEDILTEINA
jgi:hypothetical protein